MRWRQRNKTLKTGRNRHQFRLLPGNYGFRMENSIHHTPAARIYPSTGGHTDPSKTKPGSAANGSNAAHDQHIALVGAQRALLDSLPDVTWMKTVDGTLTAVNAAFGERYGMTPAEAVGKTDFDIYAPEKAGQLREEDALVISSREPLRYESTQVYGGREYWVEVVKGPIFDQHGEVIGTVGTARDISARKQAERLLLASEQRFRMLAELSSDWFWEQDSELRFTEFTVQPTLGFDLSHLIGKRRWEVPSEGSSETHWRTHRETLEARKPFYDFRFVYVAPDGQKRRISTSGKPVSLSLVASTSALMPIK